MIILHGRERTRGKAWVTDWRSGSLGLTMIFQGWLLHVSILHMFIKFLFFVCLFVQQNLSCSQNPALIKTQCIHCIATASISPTSRPPHECIVKYEWTPVLEICSHHWHIQLHAGKFSNTGYLYRKHYPRKSMVTMSSAVQLQMR